MPPHRPSRTLAAAALALIAAGACGKGEAPNPFAPSGSRTDDGRIQVRVDNQNFGDATVHALGAGGRVRVGEVTGKTERSFTVRWNFTVPMEFDIHIVGGGDCRIRALPVIPGDRVWVRIPSQMGMTPCYSGKG